MENIVIKDIYTVMGKEWKELLMQRGRMRSGIFGMLIFIGAFGVFMPITTGPEWVTSPATLAIWSWLPFLLVGGVIADAIAGERERHTLETLLASRLPDRAILFGKIAAAVSYAWGLTILTLVLSLVTVNIVHWQGRLLTYSPLVTLGVLGFSFLIGLLAAGAGILVSLRAASVREAYQKLSIGFMLMFMPLIVIVQFIPDEWTAHLVERLFTANLVYIGIAIAAFLIVGNIALLSVAMARCQRTRLILD
jgi:ABC-2 type transport system permease protein